jgi:hypothetical protein
MNAATAIRAVKMFAIQSAKRAIPPHTTAKADEGAAWDAGAVLKEAEGAAALRKISAWVDANGDPESKASYKLPHHLVSGEVVLKGVQAAGAVLQGGRGGVDIPEGDIPGVRKHLEAHYHQFDKKAPWEEQGSLDVALETICAIMVAVKQGTGFVTVEPPKVKALLGELDALVNECHSSLQAAEPPPDPHSALLMRARKAQAALGLATSHN